MGKKQPKKKAFTTPRKAKRKKDGMSGKTTATPNKGKELGIRLRPFIKFKSIVPEVEYDEDMKPDFLFRVVEDGIVKKDKDVNRLFRAAHEQQDELFSTAFTREFIKGIFQAKGYKALTDQELEHLNELVDLASSARIPTWHSGFATKEAVMQHPANRELAVFADPHKTAGLHSRLNTERRQYTEDAMIRAFDVKGADAAYVVVEGVKAAIEHTLNYFTAPITADNVFPYSRLSDFDLDDPAVQEQLASRERMKARYVELGGNLRDLDGPETPLQSWRRIWGLPRTAKGGPLNRPPSAVREVEMTEL